MSSKCPALVQKKPHRGGVGGLGQGSAPKNGTGDPARAFREHRSPEPVGVVEALEHPLSRPVKRLLELAATWPDSLPDAVPHRSEYRTARRLSPAEVDELVGAYKEGAAVHELAAKFSVHRATISRHLALKRVETRPPTLITAEVAQAADLYRIGWSLATIGERYRTTSSTVRRYLLAAGVKMRGPHERVCTDPWLSSAT